MNDLSTCLRVFRSVSSEISIVPDLKLINFISHEPSLTSPQVTSECAHKMYLSCKPKGRDLSLTLLLPVIHGSSGEIQAIQTPTLGKQRSQTSGTTVTHSVCVCVCVIQKEREDNGSTVSLHTIYTPHH